MPSWETYSNRMKAHGSTPRETLINREKRTIESKIKNSLSYHHVIVNGVTKDLTIIDSDNLNEKKIIAMPGEDIKHGAVIEWMGQHWLVVSKDYNTELNTKAIMKQCNYKLKWVNEDKNVVERWCIIEDGTKYMIGEYSDRDFVTTRGDARAVLTLPRDNETVKLGRNNRFLVDDYGPNHVLAYRLTKPFRMTSLYNGDGIYSFVLTECNTEDTDNFDLHIANYYKYFPRPDECKEDEKYDPSPILPDVREEDASDEEQEEKIDDAGRKVWF